MPVIGIHVEGTAGTRQKIYRYKAALVKRTTTALKRGGQTILKLAEPYVPVDTGAMRDSAFVRVETPIQVVCGYATHYAGFVHEDLGKAHGDVFNQKYAAEIKAGITHARRPSEQAKFLEEPINTNLVIIAYEIAKVMKGTFSIIAP